MCLWLCQQLSWLHCTLPFGAAQAVCGPEVATDTWGVPLKWREWSAVEMGYGTAVHVLLLVGERHVCCYWLGRDMCVAIGWGETCV